ncbi:MAG: aminotransferase class I/II-fold pyridoxal phosphate-dependent enzyme [Bryobacterales bacterium]|nr:aminotransferase class I/II-fold pyridoxal phosphate-dependent enzyme [Bryobacterales bacterium]
MAKSLDPTDWPAFRALGHRLLDEIMDYMEQARERPAWRPLPEATRGALRESLPMDPQGEERACAAFMEHVLPYPQGSTHPRFWGWVQGSGTPLGMLADMMASGMNPMLAGFQQAPAVVEKQVLAWLAELMAFPDDASGVLCSSGTMANFLGLAVAMREWAGSGRVYCSDETHGWMRKAAALLRLDVRRIPVDREFRISLPALRAALEEDRAAGIVPVCVVANAGTVNTGAIDPLEELGLLCASQGLWLHVDGAFGALAHLSPALRPLLEGLPRADSLAFDLHKWFSAPIDCACLLTRHAARHRATFASTPSYMAPTDRGVLAGGVPFADLGIDLTRDFKALKVWLSLKAYGVRHHAAVIEQNVKDAQCFAAQIGARGDFELLAPAPLNIVCFRYAPARLPPARLDAVNQELLLRLQESGVAVLSSTILRGQFALRMANVNHRTRPEDFDMLLATLLELGAVLS